SGPRVDDGQVHGGRILRVLAGAVRPTPARLDGTGSGDAEAPAPSLARLPPRAGPGGERSGRRLPAGERRLRVQPPRWTGRRRRAADGGAPLGAGPVRLRRPASDPEPADAGRSRAP